MGYKHTERDFLDHCHSLAVLGGTFDPIHMGHMAVAREVYDRLKPQRVLFIPSGRPAHKHGEHITPKHHRYYMTALAICEHLSFDISPMELYRQGPSYTIDTARALYEICPPGAKISFIIGADALIGILSWKDAEELLKICDFVVVPRPGYEKDASDYISYLQTTYCARIHRLDGPHMEVSSTDIRERFKTGKPVHGLLPKTVESYIRQHGLYQAKPLTCSNHQVCADNAPISPGGSFQYENAREELRVRLSPRRFTHTMGTVQVAEKLAAYYLQDVDKACIAALLHDCAKEYSADKKRMLCRQWGIQLDPVLEADIDIAHSLISAESARRDYNVRDPEILQAIRYHTTGNKGMTMLDKIIMLADYIAPHRSSFGPTNEMRSLAKTNINQALVMGIEHTVKEREQTGSPVHTWSLDALKHLKQT